MRTTVGIDLASKPKRTGVCIIDWRTASGAGEVVQTSAKAGASDTDLRALIDRNAARIGVDVPLGWPSQFSESVATYSRGGQWNVPHGDCRLRATDIWLTKELALRGLRKIGPLSVAADMIAMPAMRAARLLTDAGLEGMPRDGSAPIVEVYPAAALEAWGLPSRGYKGKDNEPVRFRLLETLLDQLAGRVVAPEEHQERIIAIDHVFDAFVAALVVRCHELGLTAPVPTEHREVARREGWILLPTPGSLERLAHV